MTGRVNVLLTLFLLLPLATGATAATACSGAPSDFDGDGRPDLAVAAPYDDRRAGSVTILYGSGREQRLTQDEPEPGDAFGAALAVGHFDGDRCADLAVGVPDEFTGARVPGADGNGVVQLYHGSPGGLRPGRELSLPEPSSDRFGASLAAGDFDGDADLAVGVPGENSVQVMPGSPRGGLSRHGDIRIKKQGSVVAILPSRGKRPAALVIAAPDKGTVTYVPGSRNLRLGKPRLKASGEGLFGHALAAG